MTPTDYGLPHTEFRPHQLESIQWIAGHAQPNAFIVSECPTGSGKTSFSKAVSTQRERTIALCVNKNLQKINYAQGYNAVALYGRANYPCIHPDNTDGATCADCLYLQSGMHHCPHSSQCTYLLAKHAAKFSPYAVLNYAYWLTAKSFRQDPPDVLFLDECHNLSEIVVNFVGCTVTEADRVRFKLPPFPKIEHQEANELFNLPDPSALALGWLEKARDSLAGQYMRLKRLAERSSLHREEFHQCEQLGFKIRHAFDALNTNIQDWYIRSGQHAREYRGKIYPAFIAKPLTARYDFQRYFTGEFATVAMSATVGDIETFTEELGITEHVFRRVPNQFTSSMRPIYILPAPAMGGVHKPDFEERAERQADVIADFIRAWNPEWSGLIHVTRKREEVDLRKRLSRRGLANRVWSVPDKLENYIPTDEQVALWHERLRKVPNSLLISCSFHEGYDGLDEKINISAKIPFPGMGRPGSYENAWMRYSGQRYRQRAAISLAQQMGRTRRGRVQDYDVNGINGACAIADNALRMVKKYLPFDVQEALIDW